MNTYTLFKYYYELKNKNVDNAHVYLFHLNQGGGTLPRQLRKALSNRYRLNTETSNRTSMSTLLTYLVFWQALTSSNYIQAKFTFLIMPDLDLLVPLVVVGFSLIDFLPLTTSYTVGSSLIMPNNRFLHIHTELQKVSPLAWDKHKSTHAI